MMDTNLSDVPATTKTPPPTREIALLKIQDVTKQFGTTKVLQHVQLEANPGEAIALIGANGAGKSTTLRIVAGMDPPDQGSVWIAGANMYTKGKAKQVCGYVADVPFFYDGLTGREHLAFLASVYRTPIDKMHDMVQVLGMEAALWQLISTYSLGMRQKLALIGASFFNPQVLLLDEPFAGFDATSRTSALELCTTLLKRGCTIFFSTHEAALVSCLATRAVYLENGILSEITMDIALEKLESYRH